MSSFILLNEVFKVHIKSIKMKAVAMETKARASGLKSEPHSFDLKKKRSFVKNCLC